MAQLHASTFGTLPYTHAIASDRRENHRLAFLKIVIELNAEQRQAVILLDAAAVLVQRLVVHRLALRRFVFSTALSTETCTPRRCVASVSISGRITADTALRLVALIFAVLQTGGVRLSLYRRFLHLRIQREFLLARASAAWAHRFSNLVSPLPDSIADFPAPDCFQAPEYKYIDDYQ